MPAVSYCLAALKIRDLSLVSAATSHLPLLLCNSSFRNEVLQGKSKSTCRIAATKCLKSKTAFCARWGEENHHPVSCQMFQHWFNKSTLENGYYKTYTKMLIKVVIPGAKNQGEIQSAVANFCIDFTAYCCMFCYLMLVDDA